MRQLFSIISPVNNEQGNISAFYDRIKRVFESYDSYDFEIVFVNDGSKDNTLSFIQELRQKDQNVKVVSLSRNFGYQAALLAGLKYAKGDVVVIITAAMTDTPELIHDFIGHWEKGYELVYGLRGKRPEAGWLTSLRNSFYKVIKFVADTDIILNMSEFSLMDKVVKNTILESYNQFPFIRSDIAYAGFSRVGIPYDIQASPQREVALQSLANDSICRCGYFKYIYVSLAFFCVCFPYFCTH